MELTFSVTTHKKSQIDRLNGSTSVPLRMATGSMLATLLVGGGLAVVNKKDVTIDVNGQQMDLVTMSNSVEGALKQAGIKIGPDDLIVPSPSARRPAPSQLRFGLRSPWRSWWMVRKKPSNPLR